MQQGGQASGGDPLSAAREGQVAVAARLLATAGVTDLVAVSADGPAVFAVGQDYSDVFPRVTLEAPQWIPNAGTCGRSGDLFITLHSWATGSDCTLVAGDVASAVELALEPRLTLTGWRVSSWSFDGSRPVGDPAIGVEHVVSTFRLSVQRRG